MIFQEFNLVDRMSVMDNVLSGRLGYTGAFRSFFKAFPREDIDRALHLLERVGLKDRVDHKPYELSGGEQQRVAIARALINEPALILADEPTGNLDSHTGEDIINLLCVIQQERQATLIVATHDAKVAARAPRIIRLVDGLVETP